MLLPLIPAMCSDDYSAISPQLSADPTAMATGVTAHGRTTPGLLQNGEPEAEEPLEPEDGLEEITLEGEELFMTLTPEERDAWQKMMDEMETSIKARKEQFDKWYDGFNRRRMFAYSRVRKLQESFRQRADFYASLSEYLTAAKKSGAKVKFVENSTEVQGHTPSDNTQQGKPQEQQQQQQEQDTVNREETVTVKPLLRGTD